MDNSTPIELWSQINERVARTDSGCWIYTGPHDHGGYGKHRTGHTYVAPHRVSYEVNVGPIPEGLVIDHLCRVRDCCNPAHLEPVTSRENIMRGEGLAARNAAQTHCLRGHPFEGDNLHVPQGTTTRVCRECRRMHSRAYKARQRARSLNR